jgi:hypothetical protein
METWMIIIIFANLVSALYNTHNKSYISGLFNFSMFLLCLSLHTIIY